MGKRESLRFGSIGDRSPLLLRRHLGCRGTARAGGKDGLVVGENGIESEAVDRSRDIAPAVVTSWGKSAEWVLQTLKCSLYRGAYGLRMDIFLPDGTRVSFESGRLEGQVRCCAGPWTLVHAIAIMTSTFQFLKAAASPSPSSLPPSNVYLYTVSPPPIRQPLTPGIPLLIATAPYSTAYLISVALPFRPCLFVAAPHHLRFPVGQAFPGPHERPTF